MVGSAVSRRTTRFHPGKGVVHLPSVWEELPRGARATGLRWEADEPPNSWVRGALRTAAPNAGPWVQFNLALGAKNGAKSPRLTRVHLDYDL